MTYTVLDIFSGAGGFSKGFEQAGFKTIGAIEFDKHAATTYKENHEHSTVYVGDILSVDIHKVKEEIGIPDIIIGGFPCQGFSIAGKRNPDDPRNRLPLEAIRYVRFFQPKIFVMENVKGLLSMENGKTLDFFIEQFEQSGYKVSYQLMKAVEYEVPQLRERLFIVGVRNDIEEEFSFPNPSNQIVSMGDYLIGIEKTGSFEETNLYNHDFYTPIDSFLYDKLKEGQFLCDARHGEEHVHSWEIELKGSVSLKEKDILNAVAENRRKKIYGPKDGNPLSEETIIHLTGHVHIQEELHSLCNKEYLEKIGDKYDIHDRKVNAGLRIFSRKKPINTITTLSGTRSPYAHYQEPRGYTVRELARLQTFPDDFIFHGPINAQYKQVGNAVPPLLAEKVALEVKKTLKRNKA
jgi:DNA (cytosine-5)-methyltransferase 1